MAKFYDEINDKLAEFIGKQEIFFVATADAAGRINLSPKGYDALRILGKNRIIWMNLSGSGNETAAHLLASDRMTLMFCSFVDPPMILRVYGSARTIHPRDEEWAGLTSQFADFPGVRQVFDVHVDSVQTSCGFGVPYFEFAGERNKLIDHFESKGSEAIERSWIDRNARSIDGLDTGIVRSE